MPDKTSEKTTSGGKGGQQSGKKSGSGETVRGGGTPTKKDKK